MLELTAEAATLVETLRSRANAGEDDDDADRR